MTNKRENSIKTLVKRLWLALPKKRKSQFWMLMILIFLSSLAEIVSLGAIVPFLGVILDPSSFTEYEAIIYFSNLLEIESHKELIGLVSITFIATIILSSLIKLLQLSMNIIFTNSCGADLSIKVFETTIHHDYSYHLNKNSSEILSGINKVANAPSILLSLITIINSSVLIIAIFLTLIYINLNIAIITGSTVIFSYLIIVKIARWRLKRNSYYVAFESTNIIKIIQEGFGGIRDILLDGSQKAFIKPFSIARNNLKRSESSSQILTAFPRFMIEAIGMILIVVIAYISSNSVDGINAVVPTLGALALGAQKLLPSIQQLYHAWGNILHSKDSLEDAIELLNEQKSDQIPSRDKSKLSYKKCIEFKNISFQYNTTHTNTLADINFKINKNQKIGIIGSTGSGKSTLIDLFMGLLKPTSGTIKVDGKTIEDTNLRLWQNNIAHVPQSIYLSDASYLENIAFGIPNDQVDVRLVKSCAKLACISDFIEDQPQKYNTIIGERGIRISGGQRQRIGIARALYKNVEVLILDEATSALDNITEAQIIESINKMRKSMTIIFIAHRLNTIKNCDLIIELERGCISSMGSYEEIKKTSNNLKTMIERKIILESE